MPHPYFTTNHYMMLAIAEAMTNDIYKLPKLGAVLITKNKSVYFGRNRRKSHPLQAKFGNTPDSIYLHAEMDAIVNAIRDGADLRWASLYVARVLRTGGVALAKPCAGCQRAIVHFGIENVEWTQ